MPSAGQKTTARVPVWLYVLFFLSGISGLMYEVVWVRMLTRVLGSTVYATSTVLAAFMAGLALGSYLAGRWIDRSLRPLAWYVAMEIGVGLSALASLGLPVRLLPVYRWIFEIAGGSRGWLTAGQVAIALAVLLVPTALMGATLPAPCAQVVRCRGSLGPGLARLYGINTLGGVVGVLAAGFVLLGELGETSTVLIGAGLNVAVGLGGIAMLRGPATLAVAANRATTDQLKPAPATSLPSEQNSPYSDAVRWSVMLCFAANGFVALATEVIWSRMLVLYLGTSVYAFSAMLAVVLACISLGSLLISTVIERLRDPLTWLAWLHLGSALAGGLALQLFSSFGFLGRPEFSNPSQLHLMTIVLTPIIMLGPMALVWGAIFPVSARCYAASDQATGRSVAELYAWNTVGCIAGSLIAGFILIPLLGSSRGAISLVALSLGAGLVLSTVHPSSPTTSRLLLHGRTDWQSVPQVHPSSPHARRRLINWALTGATVLLAATAGDPYYGLMHEQMKKVYPDGFRLYRHVEHAAGTTTAFGSVVEELGAKQLWVNGQGMTALVTVTKVMAHLPIWLAQDPREVLVVCFGMGTTVRSALRYPDLQVTTVELVPGVVDCFGFYHSDGEALLRNPNLHVVIDDGRNFLLMHDQHFDVITVDPPPPLYNAGTVNLYNREFFQLCRQRMRPGGVACVWLPPTNWTEAMMYLHTFVDVFQYSSVWSGPDYAGFYLCGSDRPRRDILSTIQHAYADPAISADLNEWDTIFDLPEKFWYLYVCDGSQLRDLLRDTAVITDDRPYTEFPLWRALRDRRHYNAFLDALQLKHRLSSSQGPVETSIPYSFGGHHGH